MNAISIGILVFIAYFGFRGFQRGLVEEVGRLIGLVLAVILADKLSPVVGPFIGNSNDTVNSALAFTLVFIVILIATTILTKTVRSLVELVLLGWLDRLGGTVFGVLKSFLILGVLIFMMQNFGPTESLSRKLHDQSPIFRQVVSVRDAMFKILTLDRLLEGFQNTIEDMNPEDIVKPLLEQNRI